MERIIDDPEYDILGAGDDVKRLATPWSEAKPLTHRLCVDGKAVETNGVTLNVEKAEELTAKIIAEPAVQEPAVQEPAVQEPAVQEPAVQEPAVQEPAVQETTHEAAIPEVNVEVNVASPSQTYLTNSDRPPPTQPCTIGVTGRKQAADPDISNNRPYRGKPPPAVAA